MNCHSHEKKLTYTPSASGSYGKHVDEIRVDSEVFKIPNRLKNIKLLRFYYKCNVILVLEMHFSWLFPSIVYFKVRFGVRKIWLLFFSCQSLLLSTSILIMI